MDISHDGLKIKYSSLKNIYIYLFAVFIVMKVWRAFSGSTEQGGFWNYIQIFYIVTGILAFLKYFRVISKESAVFSLAIYSAFALMISLFSLFSVRELTFSSLFTLVKIPFPGLILILFYTYRKRTDDMHSSDNLLKAAFYISSAILCYKLGFYMSAGGGRSADVGAVADVYYILGLLPYILTITNKKRWLIPIFVTAVSVFISQKRAGFIALVGLIIILYFIGSLRGKGIKSAIGKNILLVLLIIAGYYLMIYMDSKFNLRLFARLEGLEEDGGSGRDVRWQYILNAIDHSSLPQLLFGHGFAGAYRLYQGSHAHNDFLEVMYDYGFVTFVPYCAYYMIQVSNAVKMAKEKYPYYAEFAGSLFVSLCIAMFSYYVIDATYIICGCFVQGVLLADWRMNKKQEVWEY